MDCLNKPTFTAQLIFNWRAAEVTAAHASTEKSTKHNVLSLKVNKMKPKFCSNGMDGANTENNLYTGAYRNARQSPVI